jgi:L-ascorbate metabolism protein UlaG (beta-lactamase superfamily)
LSGTTEQAAAIAATIGARWVVPMHYRTPRLNFLEPVEGFLERMDAVHRVGATRFGTDALPGGSAPVVVLPDAP